MLFSYAKKLGLDIGSKYVKWLIYGGKGKKSVVYDWGIISLPPDTINNGRLLNYTIIKDRLLEVLENTDWKVNSGNVSISCPEMIIRNIETPKLKKNELENIINYELEQIMPVNTENYIKDYKLIGKYKENNTQIYKVLVAAVPETIVEGYIELMEALNLKPISIDFHGNCACRLIRNTGNKNLSKTIALVDIGAATTLVTIIEKGFPVFTRYIQNGGNEISRNIANSFNLSLEEGEKHKLERGKVYFEEEQIENEIEKELMYSIMPVVENILKDVFRTLDFYQSQNNKNIQGIILTGGGSLLKNLDGYFCKELNINKISLLDYLPVQLKKELPEKKLPFFTNVLGLILREDL